MPPIPQSAAIVLHRERERLRSKGLDPTPKLPCCTFWGRTLKVRLGLEDDPHWREWGGSPEGSSAWARLNSWPAAIELSGRWCGHDALQEMGLRAAETPIEGRWVVGQCWSPPGSSGVWRGDMYGVLTAPGGAELVVASDTYNGFRVLPMSEAEWLEHLRRNIFGVDSIERRLVVV